MASDSIQFDTTRTHELAPLDISKDRGLVFFAMDSQLKLHILLSVRYLAIYDFRDLPSKNTFNTAEIPTGASNRRFPNYYNGLDQTRFGFEGTRITKKGDVFVRLEVDFAGSNGFRIRHSYGQYKNLLAGQTWSLMAQVASRPTVMDNVGPTGAIIVRNPQIRYSNKDLLENTTLSVALEYNAPQFLQSNETSIMGTHLLPDLTARIDVELDKAMFQLTGILPTLSGEDTDESIVMKMGWGFSFSTKIQSWESGKWYLQVAGGRGVTRYFNDAKTEGYDVLIDPTDASAMLPLSLAGYITYEQHWSSKLFSNLSYGFSQLENPSFTPGDLYSDASTIYFHSFYSPVKGAKIGLGYNYGIRNNNDGESGDASRIIMMFFYDL